MSYLRRFWQFDHNQVEEPLPVYRRALANAEDGTVAIASVTFKDKIESTNLATEKYQIEKFPFQVGFMNNLAELLSSPPDEISELNGVELVRKKVIQ